MPKFNIFSALHCWGAFFMSRLGKTLKAPGI